MWKLAELCLKAGDRKRTLLYRQADMLMKNAKPLESSADDCDGDQDDPVGAFQEAERQYRESIIKLLEAL